MRRKNKSGFCRDHKSDHRYQECGVVSGGDHITRHHGNDELWATVAFIEKLLTMSEDDYRKLVMENIMHGGGRHNHGGTVDAKPDSMPMDHSSMPGTTPAPGDQQH